MFAQKRNIYVNMQAQGEALSANKAELVVIIYDKIISHLRGCVDAIEINNMAAKGERIKKANDLIELGLLAYLDVEAGGDVARNLQNFYTSTLVSITKANISNNIEDFKKIADSFENLKEAWQNISKQKVAA